VSGASSTHWPPAATGGQRWLFPTLLASGALATVAATIIGNGNIAVAAAPALFMAVVGALVVTPLRVPLFALIFLCLGLDSQEGPWDSPLAPIGTLLLQNLAKTVKGVNLPFQLFAAAFVFLLVLHLYRRLSGSQIDSFAYRGSAKPLHLAMACSLLVVLAQVVNGALRGGDVQMAKIQIQSFVLTLLLAYLLAVGLRNIRDYKVLGRLVLAAACGKALMAIWVYKEVLPTLVPRWEVATTHGDSMLFTAAAIMLLSRFYEQPIRRNVILCFGLLPLLFYAMVANNRRTAWVELAASILAMYIVSRRTRLKRFITQSVLIAVPILLVYVAVGWNSQARVFAPIKLFRSVGDGQVDPSTLYRDLENFNLIQMLKESPIIGSGFGHPYKIVVIMPDISFFKEWRYMPHNSVLGLWAFTGWLGFTGLSLVAIVAVYLAARSYQAAKVPVERTAAFTALAAILIYWVQCWGDIGFSERNGIFLVGPAIAVAGRLAVSTGAWSSLGEAAD
jgi:O-Antigen ligase